MDDDRNTPQRSDTLEDLDVEAEHSEDVKGGQQAAHQITSPRDPASGLPTGKRFGFIGETEKN